MTPDKNDATVMLRLPAELKHALQREAFIHGRRITAEINKRLRESLDATSTVVVDESHSLRPPSGTGDQQSIAKIAGEIQFGYVGTLKRHDELTEMEQAVLEVFRRLPPEKQLALLSLFK